MAPKADERFRDSIGTIDEKGKRKFLFPKKPSGKLYRYRKLVSYLLLAILVANPLVKVNGNQFMLFNVMERRFNIFGFPFWPQDFYLFVIVLIIMVVFVALFTVVYGRIFCGWICPQTIFLEMVFRRIEYWIDGDRNAQIKLDKQEWNAHKIRKRLMKWTIFFVISFAIANIFLAYVIGSDALFSLAMEGPLAHPGKFAALLLFTGVFYFVFTWFREQVCIIACPYGRLQGVLIDKKTINVAYDFARGEKTAGRGKINRHEDRILSGKGDCIDCALCVSVCPMGIDIRNGIQLECTNCTACIDECDTVMKSVGYPQGLIRYASEEEITRKAPFKFTARMKGYTAVLAILVTVLFGLMIMRNDVEATVLRVPGQLFQHDGNRISNVFTFRIVNKTSTDMANLELKLLSHDGEIVKVGKQELSLKGEGMVRGTMFIKIAESELSSDKTELELGLFRDGKLIEKTNTNFLSPRTFN